MGGGGTCPGWGWQGLRATLECRSGPAFICADVTAGRLPCAIARLLCRLGVICGACPEPLALCPKQTDIETPVCRGHAERGGSGKPQGRAVPGFQAEALAWPHTLGAPPPSPVCLALSCSWPCCPMCLECVSLQGRPPGGLQLQRGQAEGACCLTGCQHGSWLGGPPSAHISPQVCRAGWVQAHVVLVSTGAGRTCCLMAL